MVDTAQEIVNTLEAEMKATNNAQIKQQKQLGLQTAMPRLGQAKGIQLEWHTTRRVMKSSREGKGLRQ